VFDPLEVFGWLEELGPLAGSVWLAGVAGPLAGSVWLAGSV